MKGEVWDWTVGAIYSRDRGNIDQATQVGEDQPFGLPVGFEVTRNVADNETIGTAVFGGMFAAIDAKDTTAFVGYLTADAVFRFGSAPAVEGRDAITAAVDGFFGTIAASSHRIDSTLQSGSTMVCEGDVTYTRLDGSSVTLPFADVFELDGDLISAYKIYIDIAPLFAEPA